MDSARNRLGGDWRVLELQCLQENTLQGFGMQICIACAGQLRAARSSLLYVLRSFTTLAAMLHQTKIWYYGASSRNGSTVSCQPQARQQSAQAPSAANSAAVNVPVIGGCYSILTALNIKREGDTL